MQRMRVKWAGLLLGILLGGCVTSGVNFAPLADNALVLGATTPGQIAARLGSPGATNVITRNDREIRVLEYVYVSSGAGTTGELLATRTQRFYFYNGTLVGHQYVSSWKEDSTNFDSSRASQIGKGKSTLKDVESLLGQPRGRYIYPMVENTDEVAVGYAYAETKRAFPFDATYTKNLVIRTDRQGVVTDVQFAEKGKK